MDINSFVTGFSMGKKKGGSAILTELVVTENGVYDEPMIGGGPVEIAVGKTVQFKKHITIDDIPEHLRPTEGENSYGQIVRDDFTNSGYNIGAETVAIELVISEPESLAGVYGYFDEATALAYGVTPGWNRIVDAENIESLDVPPSILVANATSAEQLSVVSFFFEGAPTPADGWNKVTVNVAGDIIDVPELPTENIEEGKIYRVTKEGESVNDIYVVASGAGISGTLQEVLATAAYPVDSITIYPVDELPATGDPALPSESGGFAVMPVYVIRSTGEGYVYLDLSYYTGFMGLGDVLELGVGSKGVISNTSEATEDGYYFLTYQSQPSTTYGIPNAHPVKRLVDGAWVELT